MSKPYLIRGKRVLVVEDGPSITHGEDLEKVLALLRTQEENCTLINPRPYAVGSIKRAYENYPWIGTVLPASRLQHRTAEKISK